MEMKTALVGFGRFGRAFAERLLEAGIPVRASDPSADIPQELAPGDLGEVLADSVFVFFAPPIAQTETVLRQMRPHLGTDHLVMDVGSVKSTPFAIMEKVLGPDVPWLATHPLFGPTSLALGERGLRIVICESKMHPEAVARVRPLFAAIECEMIPMDPEEHDRAMAETHALSYFIAKGILDIGLSLDDPLAPPSVKALARTVRSVREDAGHLFASLHRENPYSAQVRRRLLESLKQTDGALRSPPPSDEVAHQEPENLRIPSSPETSPQLREARDVIDQIDAELMDLLARRAEISLRAARAKSRAGRGIRDPDREAELITSRRRLADDLGLNEDAVAEIFEAVLRFSRSHQRDRGEA